MVYEQVYDFSVAQTAGFNARISFLTPNTLQPIFDSAGRSVTMSLVRVSDSLPEFTWTTGNNNITLLDGATIIVNVTADELVPSAWILEVEKYPRQEYRHRIEVFDRQGNSEIAFTGQFMLYQLPTET